MNVHQLLTFSILALVMVACAALAKDKDLYEWELEGFLKMSKVYDGLQTLELGHSCSWILEQNRLNIFTAARRLHFENLTESQILLTHAQLKPNYYQLVRRAKESLYCKAQINLICDQATEKCRCVSPSQQVNGSCLLPEGAGCLDSTRLIRSESQDKICVTGSACVLADDLWSPNTPCFGTRLSTIAQTLISVKPLVSALFSLFKESNVENLKKVDFLDYYYEPFENEVCKCSKTI